MAYRALYRTWRPKRFEDVSGQAHIVKVLVGQIENNRIAHAYLFSGPRGTGKTSLAKIFARAINCEYRKGAEPCGKCEMCVQSLEDTSMDILEIDAASNNGVDSVRDLRDRVNLLPAAGKYKVYIIDEVHMLSKGAFNALLKTLEEPPSHVIFILATTEPHKLPPTILSRCQRFDFRRIGTKDISARLKAVCDAEGYKYEPAALIAIARAAQGSMRDALSILDQCAAFGDVNNKNAASALGSGDIEHVRALISAIADYNPKSALELLSDLLSAGADTHALIKSLSDAFRRIMWMSVGADAQEDEYKEYAGKFSKPAAIRALNILIQKEYEMRQNLRADIVLETAIMDIMFPEDDISASDSVRIEKLEARLAKLENRKPAPVETDIAKTKAAQKQKKHTETISAVSAAADENIIPAKTDAGSATDANALLSKMLDTLKQDAYPLYPYAAKALWAKKQGNVLMIMFGKDDKIAADFLSQPKFFNVIVNTLVKITDDIKSVRILTQEDEKEPPEASIYTLFGENEIEKV